MASRPDLNGLRLTLREAALVCGYGTLACRQGNATATETFIRSVTVLLARADREIEALNADGGGDGGG